MVFQDKRGAARRRSAQPTQDKWLWRQLFIRLEMAMINPEA
jgi:hypothetical protein